MRRKRLAHEPWRAYLAGIMSCPLLSGSNLCGTGSGVLPINRDVSCRSDGFHVPRQCYYSLIIHDRTVRSVSGQQGGSTFVITAQSCRTTPSKSIGLDFFRLRSC